MIELICIPAILIGLYGLWITGRADLLRLVQGTAYVRARVVRHQAGSDGFTAIYAFQHGSRACEVPAMTAHASPTPPVGSSEVLGFPRKRPDLARPQQFFERSLLYGAFALWLAFFSNLWLGWW